MKIFLVITFLILSCRVRTDRTSNLADSGVPAGEFRGVEVVGNMLNDTLFTAELSQLQRFVPTNSNSVFAQMGAFSGSGKNLRYENGKPSAVNAILWAKTFRNLAQDILAGNAGLKKPAESALNDCKVAKDLKSADQCLGLMWDHFLLASLPPRDEKAAWVAAFSTELFESSDKSSVLSDAIVTAFMNPYYILKN